MEITPNNTDNRASTLHSLTEFLEIAGDWAFELDADTNIVFAHKSVCSNDNWVPSDYRGKPFRDFLPRHHQKKILDLLDSCRELPGASRRTTYIDHNGCHIELDLGSRWRDGRFAGYNVLGKNLSTRLSTGWCQGKSSRAAKSLRSPEDGLNTENELLMQLKLQELVTAISLNFTNVTDYTTSFAQTFSMLGNFLSADRVTLFQDDPGASIFVPRQEWLSQQTTSCGETPPLRYDNQNNSYMQLLTLPFVAVNDAAQDPFFDREATYVHNARSYINLPFRVKGAFWGFLSIACLEPKEWTISEVNLIQSIGGILTSAIEKQTLESAMGDAFSMLDGIVKNYPGIIWYLDKDYNLTLSEGNCADIDMHSFTGQNLFDLDINRQYTQNIQATYHQGPQTFIIEINGRFFTCNTNPLRDADGNIAGQVGIAQDITQLRNMQTELEKAIDEAERANQAKTEFLSRMSHEIRTPMNAIIGMNSIARKTDELGKIRYCLDKIETASRQLLGLINDVLDMSKIEANKLEINHMEFDFEKMLQNVCNVVGVRAAEKELNFRIDFDDVFLSHVVCDELRLSQVMTNLLSNAIKFTPRHGEITLKIRHFPVDDELSMLHVEVQDTGIGVAKEKQGKLFQAFEQADGSITRHYGGTGLGLALCKKIVDLMNGKIWMESEEGKGSRFSFEVEFRWGSELIRDSLDKQLDDQHVRILTIDPDREARAYFKNILDSFSIRNDVAANSSEAMSLLKIGIKTHNPYSLILVDLNTSDTGGLDAAKKIRTLSPESVIVIIATMAEWMDIEQEALDCGIHRFLPKPAIPSMLFNTIMQTIPYSGFADLTQKHTETYSWRGKRILLAEDIDINQEIILNILEDTQVQIDCVATGRQAVERFCSAPDQYDLILMDIQMPDLDGLQATRAIRQSGAPGCDTIPIIAMTANAFTEDVDRCLDAGMNDHVAKPINVEELMGKLDAAMNVTVHLGL